MVPAALATTAGVVAITRRATHRAGRIFELTPTSSCPITCPNVVGIAPTDGRRTSRHKHHERNRQENGGQDSPHVELLSKSTGHCLTYPFLSNTAVRFCFEIGTPRKSGLLRLCENWQRKSFVGHPHCRRIRLGELAIQTTSLTACRSSVGKSSRNPGGTSLKFLCVKCCRRARVESADTSLPENVCCTLYRMPGQAELF